jgi:hypothetical protein
MRYAITKFVHLPKAVQDKLSRVGNGTEVQATEHYFATACANGMDVILRCTLPTDTHYPTVSGLKAEMKP